MPEDIILSTILCASLTTPESALRAAFDILCHLDILNVAEESCKLIMGLIVMLNDMVLLI